MNSNWTARLAGLTLLLVTLVIYWPVGDFDFVNYDDPLYVTENPAVANGLTTESLRWAFLSRDPYAGIPLTTLSYILESAVFGLSARAFHWTNLLLHTANTILLFAVLRRLTGAVWRSALVAALFAWHPLHVEAVAWVSARKDLLSVFFSLLTIWAYARFVEKSKIRNQKSGSGFYFIALLLFVFGLMSKPTVIALPFLLLLLDFWPLKRFELSTLNSQPFALLREKLPFLALALVAATVSFTIQSKGRTLSTLAVLPVGERLANALISYVRYLHKTIWPSDLAVFYPYPAVWATWKIAGAALLLAGVSLVALRCAKGRPYFVVGWFWFLGTLVPVIGLVQTGGHSLADRYTYLPLSGLFVVLVWCVWDWVKSWRYAKPALCGAFSLALLGCVTLTSLQLQHWRDSEALFEHALRVTTGNYIAHNNLGAALARKGLIEDAMIHYAAALKMKPDRVEAHNNLGLALVAKGRLEEAKTHYLQALQNNPRYAPGYFHLANLLDHQGKPEEAILNYERAVELEPGYAEAHNNLGCLLVGQGNLEAAIAHFRQALRVRPDYVDAYNNLGGSLTRQGKYEEAVRSLAKAVELKPEYADAHYNMGAALKSCGRISDAVTAYGKAVELNPEFAPAQCKLADILVGQGKIDEAARHYAAALQAAPDYAEAHYQLGVILAGRKQTREGIAHFREAVRLKPDWLEALNNLAWILATDQDAALRDGATAVLLAKRAADLTDSKNVETLDTLAAAYAEAKRFADAVKAAEQSIELARSTGREKLAASIEPRLRLYHSDRPYRE